MKKPVIYILSLVSSLSLLGQGNITLNTPQTTGGTQVACQSINLKPGFSFLASGTSSLILKADPTTCDPYGGSTEGFSSGQNYILTRTYTKEDASRYLDQVQYFDGLGRPVQAVQRGITPDAMDLVSIQEYDAFGRESNAWLPGKVTTANNGAFVALETAKGYTKASNAADQKPYSVPVYEASPLSRVLKQFGPGQDWQDNGKAVTTGYLTNTAKTGTSLTVADSLVCAQYTSTDTRTTISVSRSGNYAAAQLYITRMKDEDGNTSYEFKDKLGQVVLTRQVNAGTLLDTYYIYDSFGNLRVVLPPMVSETSASGTWTDATASWQQYAYLYKYDDRNRCIWKKLPGCEPIYYVYDKADRLIFTQDGEQRAKGEWLFSIPDAFGRPVLTGICKNTLDYAADPLKNVVVSASWSKATNTYKGYTITGITLTLRAVLSANYYDNYEFMGLNSIPANTDANFKYTAESGYGTWYGTDYTDANKYKNKGLLTGTLTTRYQSDGAIALDYLYSVMYYDNKARIIQSKSTNHLGGIEKEYIAYNFTGQPTKKMHIHSATGKNTLTEVYTYSYDHAGRLLTTTHQLTDGTAVKGQVTLAENSYDDLGRLKTNKKGGQANAATTYGYNIRSWTKSITSPLFSETLYYNESYGGSTKQYNGNISAINWQVQGESYKRGYSFAYDNLSRLTTTNYLKDGVVQVHTTNGSTPVYQTVNTYDKHGNIKTMQRYGKTAAATYGLIDNLTFDYTGTGNQLRKVTDAVANFSLAESADFKNYGGTNSVYTYNKNGAMESDSHKGILGIKYNSLNLPYELLIKNTETSGKIYYTYTASGVKLNTKHMKAKNLGYTPATGTAGDTNMDVIQTTDYVGSVIYEGGVLKRILVDGGYYEGGVYYYYLSDHLGNNRVVANQSGTPIQKNHYYPFGTAFAEGTAAEQGKQPYKYNGKELDPLLGLNMYDYSARYYEPAIGRFTTVDPLAEMYSSISPYAYCNNNPVRFIDSDGRSFGEFDYIDGEWKKISNIGDDIGVDFYHMKGVTNASGKEITNVTDRKGNWIEMSDGRNALKGGVIRGDNVNWETITDEYIDGNGPTKSVFEGNHEANEAIQEHYLYKNTFADFKASGKPKAPYVVKWSPLDVAKTRTNNKQAQMMGSYNVSFYKLGENTLSFIQDSKSKTSIGLHLPFKNEDRKEGPVYNPWAGAWQKPNNSYKNTYQIYLFWAK